jgi:hypothetical protein
VATCLPPQSRRWLPILAALLAISDHYVASAAAEDSLPVRFRAEVWDFYQNNADGSDENKVDLRFYQTARLLHGGLLTIREDLPIITTDKTGPQNSNGEWLTGIGDAFVQALIATPEVATNLSLEFGGRLVFPTGGLPPFGTGNYQVAPTVAANLRIPDFASGLEISPTARYFTSFAAAYDGASPVPKLELFPKVAVGLNEAWSVGLWLENPIVYDDLTNEWFVPLDAMITGRLTDRLVVAIGGAVKLIDDYPQYDQMVYGRLSVRFLSSDIRNWTPVVRENWPPSS